MAINDVQRAFTTKDVAGICSRMSTTAKRQAGQMSHGGIDTCEWDVREALLVLRPAEWREPSRIHHVTVDGEKATAVITMEGQGQLDIPLRKQGGRWRIDSFFGTPPSDAHKYRAETRTAEIAESGGNAVVATGEHGSPCSTIEASSFPEVDGGCEVEVSVENATVDVATVFGSFEFGQCSVDYDVLVDGDGNTRTTRFRFNAKTLNGCADMGICRNASYDALPWPGRIEEDDNGGFVHRMRACLDTCVGYYVGELVMRFEPTRSGLRVRPTSGIGSSGLRFGGALAVEGSLGLRPAG